MGNRLIMQINHGLECAFDVGGSFFGRQGFLFVEIIKKGTILNILKDKINGIGVLKEAIEFYNVRVIK